MQVECLALEPGYFLGMCVNSYHLNVVLNEESGHELCNFHADGKAKWDQSVEDEEEAEEGCHSEFSRTF